MDESYRNGMGLRRLGGTMSAIFLSAGVPTIESGNYHESADPFLIQIAVREFVTLALGRRLIVWGGHPAITPMIWAVCEDLGVNYAEAVVLYQSMYFEEDYPEENRRFKNVVYTSAISNDREASLIEMRRTMLSRGDLKAAVFIGGMNGVEEEYRMFHDFHPEARSLLVGSCGGAALRLGQRLGLISTEGVTDVDFASLFFNQLQIRPDEPRSSLAR